MKHLAFLSFAIVTLLAPITAQAQTVTAQAQTACVTFPAPPDYEAELRYILATATQTYDPGRSMKFEQWLRNSAWSTIDQINAMNGRK